MTFAGPSWTGLTEAVGRGLRTFGRGASSNDGLDPYERAPLKREEMAALFELEQAETPIAISENLRASERHERDSLSIIRAALYPQD